MLASVPVGPVGSADRTRGPAAFHVNTESEVGLVRSTAKRDIQWVGDTAMDRHRTASPSRPGQGSRRPKVGVDIPQETFRFSRKKE